MFSLCQVITHKYCNRMPHIIYFPRPPIPQPHLRASRLVRLRLILALQRIHAIDEFHHAALVFGGRGHQLRVLRAQCVALALPRALELPVHAADERARGGGVSGMMVVVEEDE